MINYTIVAQIQNPYVVFLSQVLAVFIGGVIALVANYVLQMHSFSIQNETNQMNRRIDAYIGLLGAISRYESTSLIDGDLMLHVLKASIYGSLTVNKEIEIWVSKLADDNTDEFRKLASNVRLIIVTEMGLGQMVDNKRWQFWR